MSELFREKDHSELYAKFRPPYPSGVYKLIADKLEKSFAELGQTGKKWKMALDVCCGTGISTLPLVEYFQESFGVDGSESQIYEAKKNYGNRDPSRVTFLCYDASAITQMFAESSFDLITVAQALHHIANRPTLYDDCKKLLKPGGLFVAYGYSLPIFHDPKAQKVTDEFYNGSMKKYINFEVDHVEDCYTKILPEISDYFSSSERDDSLVLHFDVPLDEYVGYLSSWSMYRLYRKENPGKEDPLEVLSRKYVDLYPGKKVTLKYDSRIFMVFGRKA